MPNLPGKYQITATIDINNKKQDVWEVMQDFSNVYTWAPSVNKSYHIGEGEHCIGAGRHCHLEGFGEIDEYITLWQEGTGFVYDVSPLGPLNRSYSRWWLTELDQNTTRVSVMFSYDLRFGLFGKLMHSLIMHNKIKTSLPQTLTALKARVETGRLVRPILNVAAVN